MLEICQFLRGFMALDANATHMVRSRDSFFG
jgi:hypothetical protein